MEIHAFCLMTSHYHLLVRSPIGELSEAMRLAQSAYSRYFNRRHKRDEHVLSNPTIGIVPHGSATKR